MALFQLASLTGWSISPTTIEAGSRRADAQGTRGRGLPGPDHRVGRVQEHATLGLSGEKEGPYDWVPPSYWYDTSHSDFADDSSLMLGADFVQYYVLMKRFEAEKYRQQVSPWEVRRYAEMA
jgi:hypothetical protein